MITGTTPTFKLKLAEPTVDLTEAINVYASFSQNNVKIIKSTESLDITPNEVDVYLTQEETLKFSEGTLDIQLNWTYEDGSRAATYKTSIEVENNLIGKVLE